MFTKKTVCGFKDDIGYEIVYPLTENDGIQQMIDGLAEDLAFYFENSFGRRIKERLTKHKRGRAYGELYVTFESAEHFSFVILMGGFDGNEIVVFECIPLTLDKCGYIVPLSMHRGMTKRKNRPYFLLEENIVCLPESYDVPQVKIRKTELWGLLKYKRLS